MSDVKSVTTDIKTNISFKSSNYSAINKLSLQLDDERKEREKMKLEIEELKKMNSELCSAILNPKGSPVKKQ